MSRAVLSEAIQAQPGALSQDCAETCLRRSLRGEREGRLTSAFLGCVPAPWAAAREALQPDASGVWRLWEAGWPQVEPAAKESRVRRGPDELRWWPNRVDQLGDLPSLIARS